MEDKIMIIGPIGSGKTTLLRKLFGGEEVHKTQTVEFNSLSIDTPGEFFQNPRLYKALITTSMDAKLILMVQDASNPQPGIPSGFGAIFPCPIVGIITKIDHPKATVQKAEEVLKEMGIEQPIFPVSSFTEDGIKELSDFLNSFISKKV